MSRPHPLGWSGGGTPPAVWALLIANVAIFLFHRSLDLVGGGGLLMGHTAAWHTFTDWFGLVPRRTLLGLNIWQPVTYLFLHGDLFHVGLNMLMLWMFGAPLERAWGSRAFWRYYLVCGVGAAVTTCALAFSSRTIGASGAVFGLLLAYGMLWPNTVILIWGIIPMRARTMVWLSAGIELYSLVFSAGGGIAYAAHLGGMLFGFLYLRRAWRLRDFLGDLRWRLRRRRFRILDRRGDGDRFH